MKQHVVFLCMVVGLSGLFTMSCTKNDESKRLSRRGETCSYTNDCKNTLACVEGVCVQDEFPVAAVANVCVRIECRTAENCCEDLNLADTPDCRFATQECERQREICMQRESQCGSDLGDCSSRSASGQQCGDWARDCAGGDEEACDRLSRSFNTGDCSFSCSDATSTCRRSIDCSSADECEFAEEACTCTYQCQGNRCVLPREGCNEPEDCGVGRICQDGSCVECVSDENCGDGTVCEDGTCVRGCTEDINCGLFRSCEAGHCVSSGCRNNRQCILYTGRGEAICRDKVCRLPCQANSQCGYLQACVDATCTFIGCQDVYDCQALESTFDGNPARRGELLCVPMSEVSEGANLVGN